MVVERWVWMMYSVIGYKSCVICVVYMVLMTGDSGVIIYGLGIGGNG